MSDQLEKFIKAHRADMDDKEPRPDLWIDIANQINSKKEVRKSTRSIVWWRAAAVFLLFVSALLVLEKYVSQPVPQEVVMNEQLQEAESFYTVLIAQKKEEVATLSQQLGLDHNFVNEIDELDSMYTALKSDLQKGDEDNVVDAMILNLQLRIEILNRQLDIIQSIKNSKNFKDTEDETVSL
jgi:hypothetical protein